MKFYSQKASGTVSLKVDTDSPHCSITSPEITIDYTINIGFSTEAKDNDGFLLNSLDFSKYFENLKSSFVVTISCEDLAHKICKDFLVLTGWRVDDCLWVKIELSPFPGVVMTYVEVHDEKYAMFV